MNSVISFTAAQLHTVSSIITLIHYPRAVIQFSAGRWSLLYFIMQRKTTMPFAYKGKKLVLE